MDPVSWLGLCYVVQVACAVAGGLQESKAGLTSAEMQCHVLRGSAFCIWLL
jgi:hypothetical protein